MWLHPCSRGSKAKQQKAAGAISSACCQEEFLRRLEKSKYAENLVLKGGLFLYSLTDFDSRVTADVDFLLRKLPNTPEQLRVILEEIIATETSNDFVTFEIKTVAPIAVAKKYAGIGLPLWQR